MSSNLQNVEHRGFEPLTSSMPWKRATNCANAPKCLNSIYNLGGDSKLKACLTYFGRARGSAEQGVWTGTGGVVWAWTRRVSVGQGVRARTWGVVGGKGRHAHGSEGRPVGVWCVGGVARAGSKRGGRKPSWRAAAGGLRLPSMTARHRGCARDCTAQSYALVTDTFPADP